MIPLKSIRFRLMLILSLGTINLFAQRTCLSLTVLCMTNHTATTFLDSTPTFGNISYNHTNTREDSLVDREYIHICWNQNGGDSDRMEDGPFTWDASVRGRILGAYFWGYLIGQIPAGSLNQKLGARILIFVNMLLMGVSTLLIPLLTYYSVYYLYILRGIAGFASAVFFPGFYQIWASWAPITERGILVGVSFAGVHIGCAISLPIAGALCQTSIGWPLVFYVFGGSSIAYGVLWILTVFDTPTRHPSISDAERRFLYAQCADSGRKRGKQGDIPLLAMLTSVPVWAFTISTMGYDWNSYNFLTSVPTYLREVLYFDLNQNAILSAFPFLGLWIGQLIFGSISDFLLQRKLVRLIVLRKVTTAIGMFGPGILILILTLFDCRQKYVPIVLFTLGLILNSSVGVGALLNPIELSPRHAGLIFAGANTLSAATGIFAPIVASALTPNHSYEEWRYVFYVGAAIYFSTGTFFVCFSSSSVQPWAISPTDIWASGDLGLPVSPIKKFPSRQSRIFNESTTDSEFQRSLTHIPHGNIKHQDITSKPHA